MVVAIPESTLKRLNIDTVERGIVFATLGLKLALTEENGTGNFNQKIKINIEKEGASKIILKLELLLPYNSYIFARNGGKMIYAVQPFQASDGENITNLLDFPVVPTEPTPSKIPLPSLPINWLETYLFHNVAILSASLEETRNRVVDISFVDNQVIRVDDATRIPIDSKSEVKIKLRLPINAKRWLEGRNLVECVERIALVVADDSIFDTVSFLTDDIFLTDQQLLID